MGRVYRVVDTLVFVICLPFYVVVVPLMLAHQWFLQRRAVRLGSETTHWPMRDVREDYLVVDVSRVSDGLVGIRKRRWSPMSERTPPAYPDHIDYIPRAQFWVPHPFSLRGKETA